MTSKPKTAKREHSSEIVAVVIALREQAKSYAQTADHVKLPRTTVAHIINRAAQTPDDPYRPIKRAWRHSERPQSRDTSSVARQYELI